MTKKMFDNNTLRSTVAHQDQALEDRFAKADSILLKTLPPTPEPVPAPQKSLVVRDTFSLPPSDYALIDAVRRTAAKEGRISTSKSEVIRAGLQVLHLLEGQDLIQALDQLEKILPGRKK
ncbi:hypothetical protein MasN3_36930 [Massilia varians]|uniref:Uncharacterized protein n=1 Tax=Massilia varians TaxID=457921 RepID=A0ABM8CA86_9BURK|nr:hypothetical protein [Massilia varians]BDT60199.1 hypothetical protein MasN3_36930 [Massilia varians]